MDKTNAEDGQGRLAHHGRGTELFVIFITNLLLKIVTLGIYHFWAQTRVRRYLWSQTAFDGERLEYTGTGKELFLGFLKAVVILAGVAALVSAVFAFLPIFGLLLAIPLYLLVPVLIGFAIYGALRYKLTRTRLRGIRFGLAGSGWDHGFKLFGYSLLTGITLGLYSPFMRNNLASHVYNNTYFGSQKFSYDGSGGDLFGRFLAAIILTIPTLGLAWLWYRAVEFRYQIAHLRAGELQFEVVQSNLALAWFFFTNALIIVFTLGLGLPWVTVRMLRYIGEQTRITGQWDYDAILQAQEEAEAVGEGFAEALDVGAF